MSSEFFWGFLAGAIVMFVVGTVWAANQFWQQYEKYRGQDMKIFDLEQEVIHLSDGRVEVEWSEQSGVSVKKKRPLWEDDLYVAGSDTVIIPDHEDS